MEDIWLTRAKRLQAIASSGLHYCESEYDRDRYRELSDIAHAMLSDIGSVPVSKIEALIPDFAQGYVTPRVDVRAAVFCKDEILLVQEKTDENWCLPGGFADVGYSPSENVVKEVAEEAGLVVTASHLYLLRHKARHGYSADTRDFYKLFFLCETTDNTAPSPGTETLAARYFSRDALPDLSLGRTIPQDIHAAFDARQDTSLTTRFD